MADLWRIRLVTGTGGASGGDWRYYESREAMEAALLVAACQAAEDYKANRHVHERMLFRAWRVLVQRKPDPEGWTVQRIVGVDHMQNGEWVECEWALSPPQLKVEAR